MSPPIVTIRRACPGEGAALSALMLRSKAHWGYDDAFLEKCRVVLIMSEEAIAAGEVIVAELDGAVVGVAALTDEAPEVELDVCFVEPAVIGAGVGRVLVDAAKQLARDRGAVAMSVQSDPNAEAFYRRLGAVRVGDVRSDIDEQRFLPLLRFDLSA